MTVELTCEKLCQKKQSSFLWASERSGYQHLYLYDNSGIYIHIFLHVYTNIYIYVCVCIYTYLHTHAYTHTVP